MKEIKFDLDEMENIFISLAYMFSNLEARKEYKTMQLDYNFVYPSTELDVISSILIDYAEDENILFNFEVIKELRKSNRYENIFEYANSAISEPYYKAFIEKIKGNIDSLADDSLISYEDSKQAFLSYVGGDLRALINSNDEYKFVYWNGRAWEKKTDEEGKIIYNDFIEKCNLELNRAMLEMEKADYSKISKKVHGWDSRNRVNEALDKLKRDKSHIINIKTHNKNENIICSKNGMIINLNTGEIKVSCRNDLILNTSKYNLVDRQLSEEFVNSKLKIYEYVLGKERLNFILDLIAYKMLGKNLQLGIFMIGAGATGKSTFKNIIKDLFENNISNVPYEYSSMD